MKLSAFLVSEASTMATNYNNAHMEHCNRANFQVADSRKVHARRLVSYLLINNSYYHCNQVAIDLMMIAFSRISSKTATILYPKCLMYMEIANLFLTRTPISNTTIIYYGSSKKCLYTIVINSK